MWRSYQRAIDLKVLWPICKREAFAKSGYDPVLALDWARASFAVHAFNDPAWRALGEPEIIARIDKLE
jgi:hypothetical protein